MKQSERKADPTMVEVAKKAGVSVATVSRVVNNSGTVSPKLEQRVLKAMQKLNYHPSTLARSFKKQQTMLIGVLIPILEHPSYSRMASSIEKRLFEQGYRALICNSEEDEQREKEYIEMLLRQRVDGMIINSSARDSQSLMVLGENNIPIVLFDRNLKDLRCNKVFCDNSMGGFTGMEHLIQLGHERIGVVGAPSHPEPIIRRVLGIRQAMTQYEMPYDPELMVMGDTQLFDMGYNAARQLMALASPPTAIFALTDVTAVGVMHAVAELGYKVPDDISVLGYDDIPIASYIMPPLTTVAQPIVEMGRTAVDLLLRQIEDGDLEPQSAVLETRLVIRSSTAPPREVSNTLFYTRDNQTH
ncbi:MAG: LacI family DNA-binding transcriptional regulator [Chitinophagaceae bacterium]|nr:LacI family DNA-binding transcriptional regulator [Anaerolineae bacterium]